MKPTVFELEVKEQEQLERDYADWCRKYDPNYIVERDSAEESKYKHEDKRSSQ
jgi:hypothetical protein